MKTPLSLIFIYATAQIHIHPYFYTILGSLMTWHWQLHTSMNVFIIIIRCNIFHQKSSTHFSTLKTGTICAYSWLHTAVYWMRWPYMGKKALNLKFWIKNLLKNAMCTCVTRRRTEEGKWEMVTKRGDLTNFLLGQVRSSKCPPYTTPKLELWISNMAKF